MPGSALLGFLLETPSDSVSRVSKLDSGKYYWVSSRGYW